MNEVESISHGMHRLSPHMVCAGAAEAIDFYIEAFGAEEIMRTPGPDGKLMHAAVSINGSSVMLVDENLDVRPALGTARNWGTST